MNKKYIMMISTALFVFGTPVFAAETYESQSKVEQDDNGNYSEKDKIVKKDGTAKTTQETNFNANVDSKGNTDKTLETNSTKKTGWFSKDSVKTKDTEKTANDGTVLESSHKKVVNGTTTESDINKTP